MKFDHSGKAHKKSFLRLTTTQLKGPSSNRVSLTIMTFKWFKYFLYLLNEHIDEAIYDA